MTPVPASQQIQQLTQQLTQQLVEKLEHDAKSKECELSITAIRNVLAGIGLGQQLAAEMPPAAQPQSGVCDH